MPIVLFGDEANPIVNEAAKWTGPVLASVSAMVAALFGWLTTRDKLRFDVGVAQMKADIAGLQKETAECHRIRDEDRQRLQEERERDRQRYEGEIQQLRNMLAHFDRRQTDDPSYQGPRRRAEDSPPGDSS